MMKQLWAALMLAAVAASSQGCTRACTLVDWTEGLTVELKSKEPLTPGAYRVNIDLPGESIEFVLNVDDDHGFWNKRVAGAQWYAAAELYDSESRLKGEVVVDGDDGGPQSATITVEQDGANIGQLELPTIHYAVFEPNGPGCGEARTATARLTILPVQ